MKEIPFSIQWPIAENRLIAIKESANGYLCSTSALNIQEFEYYLQIFPNRSGDERRGPTSIGLYLILKNVKKVEVDCTVTIESSNYSRKIHRVYEGPIGWGPGICPTEVFFDPEKKYIVDGKFTFKVYGIFKFETEKDGPIPVAIVQKWNGGKLGDEFWKKDGTKDFTIISSDGKEIKVHKCVLDVRSEVFTAMLNSNMTEATENKVTIPDFSLLFKLPSKLYMIVILLQIYQWMN